MIKEIPVFFASDKNYLPYLSVAIISLIEKANNEDAYKIYVLSPDLVDSDFAEIDKKGKDIQIRVVDIKEKIETIRAYARLRDYYSLSIYSRLFIPEMFSNYKKVIYVDSDIVLNSDIANLFNIDIGNNLLGAVADETVQNNEQFIDYIKKIIGVDEEHYFNSGVLVMNLDKFRELDIEHHFYEWLSSDATNTVAPDQDYLNMFCKGNVTYLEKGWDKMPLGEKLEDEKLYLIHYNMFMKPWKYKDIMYGEYFWNYAKKTKYYDMFLHQADNYSDADKEKDAKGLVNLIELTKQIVSQKETDMEKAPDRIIVLKKIDELEREGIFDVDVEDDPPSVMLMPDQVDYLRKKLSSKISRNIAYSAARKFMNKLIKDNQLIIKDVIGIENWKNLETGAILTCNHFNAMDSFAMQYAYDQTKFKKRKFYKVIKEANFNFGGFYGFLMRNCNTLPLSSNSKTMQKFIEAVDTILKRNEFILVYPEQSMWWNYRKPKPLKTGAYNLAVRNNVPILPCFITMEDSKTIGADGFPIQEYTIHISKPIYADESLSKKDKIEYLKNANFEVWKEIYEKTYGLPLTYKQKA